MRRLALLAVAALLLLGLGRAPARGLPTIERFGISSDAEQRGTVAQFYPQQNDGPLVVLGRSDDPSLRRSGGFQARTDIQVGERVRAVFIEGWNAFGQSFSGEIYGSLDPSPFTDAHPSILERPRTRAVVPWRQTSVPMRLGYTPDLSPLVNELAAQPGFDGTVTILVIGGGGADNQSIDWRSSENLTGPAPVLEVQR